MTKPGMKSHDDWLPDPPTDMEAKALACLRYVDLHSAQSQRLKAILRAITEAHREGMEESAKVVEETNEAQPGWLQDLLKRRAAAIREKIKG